MGTHEGKFKVGDRFRRTKTDRGSPPRNFVYGYEGFVAKVDDICVRDEEGCGHSFECIELINDSPVRTITRREIVSGQYGIVRVEAGRQTGNPRIFVSAVPLPTELREAARIFDEIADALEESA